MSNNIKLSIDSIIEEYSNYVFKIVNNTVGSNLSYQDKEEIVSDTFYLFWKNASKINTNLKSYLGSIARNCAYTRLRKNELSFNLEENFTPSYELDFDSIITIKEKLKKLTKEENQIFYYYYILGFKVKEISKNLNKSLSYIKIKLYRIRKKLKEELK